MHDLGTYGLEVENYFVIFEISTLEFVYLQNFMKNQKHLNLRCLMLYLGIFGIGFQNKFVIFEINSLEFA